jgi:hypothetical protein
MREIKNKINLRGLLSLLIKKISICLGSHFPFSNESFITSFHLG